MNTQVAKPVAAFGSKDQHPSLVWQSTLDKRYQIEVARKDQDTGILRVFDHQNNDQLMFEEEVALAYGARFGPDGADIGLWQEKVLKLVDK